MNKLRRAKQMTIEKTSWLNEAPNKKIKERNEK